MTPHPHTHKSILKRINVDSRTTAIGRHMQRGATLVCGKEGRTQHCTSRAHHTWISSSAMCCCNSATAAMLSASRSLTAMTSSLFYSSKQDTATKQFSSKLSTLQNFKIYKLQHHYYPAVSEAARYKQPRPTGQTNL